MNISKEAQMKNIIKRNGVEKAKDFQGTIRKILAYMSSYKPALVVVCIFAVASTVFNVIGPKILIVFLTVKTLALNRAAL